MIQRLCIESGGDGLQNSDDRVPKDEDDGKLWLVGVPLIFCAMYLLVGLFFRRPDMGDPDSYRQALSALAYLKDGTYSAYWDFPLTMYTFVSGTYLASVLGLGQLVTLNTLAVLLGAAGVWPLYHLIRKFVNPQSAAFASAAYVLSPTLIRYSTYLSHEIVGYAFAIWSVYLFELALERRDSLTTIAFGLFFGAAFSARTNGAAFIVPPLLLMFLRKKDRFERPDIGRFAAFALLGFAGCLLLMHRPDTVLRFKARMDVWFFTYYEIGQFVVRTTGTALQSLTPALVATTVVGACVLAYRRKYFVVLLGCVWIMTVYLFYVGMDICRLKFFLVVLPPCMLLAFAGADQLDAGLKFGRERPLHIAKIAVALLLVLLSLGPSLPELLYIRQSDDNELMAKGIGSVVGRELLFTTSLRPIIDFYNFDNPPETVYLITELKPGTRQMDTEALRLAQLRLRQGRPVFATGLIIEHLKHLKIDFDAESAWEYKSQRLFRITRLNFGGMAAFDPEGA